jgi:dipeptidyl-peptidase-4
MALTTRCRSLLPLLIVAGAGSVSQTKEPLTVERIFQSPSLAGVSVSKVQWSSDGRGFAYLRSGPEDSGNELWWFDVRRKVPGKIVDARQVTGGEQKLSKEEQAQRERRRQSVAGIADFQIVPGGEEVLIPLNGNVYKCNIENGKIQQLTFTPSPELDPTISPKGNLLAYVRDGELYVKDLSSLRETRLTHDATPKLKNGVSEFVAQEEMGRRAGYAWSPDGSRIAYLQVDNGPVTEFHIQNLLDERASSEIQEYPRAGGANAKLRLGVVSVGGGETQWIDLREGTDRYVARFQWMTDGSSLAVQLQTRDQDTLDLLAYDVSSGTSRLLVREVDARWVKLHDHLVFLKRNKQFLWSSERDGFRHLYLYDMKGTLVNQVSKGTWEVDKVAGVDEEEGMVYFTANEQSPRERHLYRVGLGGSGFARITKNRGWHDITMAPDRNSFVDSYSTATQPPIVFLSSPSGARLGWVEENASPDAGKFALPSPEFMMVKSGDGTTMLYAYMIKPSSFDSTRKYPVIQYVYGGPTSQIVEDRWGSGGGMARQLWHRMMAEDGYIVFGVDNRGTPGRGREFQNTIYRRLGEVELEDQCAGAAYLGSLPYVDASRIMVWGKSYGGYMTCMAMTHPQTPFALGVALAPVTDWHNYDTHYTERYMDLPQENAGGYRSSSPVYRTEHLSRRLLLVHGMADDNVHFQESVIFADRLQKQNKQFSFMPYPTSTHAFSGNQVGLHLYSLLTRYIHDNL